MRQKKKGKKMTLLKLNCNIRFPTIGAYAEFECDNEQGSRKIFGNKYYGTHSATFDGKTRDTSKYADIHLINGETLTNVCLTKVEFIGKCPITYTGKSSSEPESPSKESKEEKGGFFS